MSPTAFVVSESDVPARAEEGDTAAGSVTFDASNGCERLEQRVIQFAAGRSLPHRLERAQEVLYVVSGTGSLHLDGKEHRLAPDTAVLIGSGQAYGVETSSGLKILSVRTPAREEDEPGLQIVRFADCEERRADENRTFRVLIETGVTQFVGIVEPCRAPDHSHPYDEVGYILEGRGFAHVGGDSIPIGPGSCFHLPPQQVHCIENTGPGVMRILGVFFPSGSPKQRAYEASET